MKALFSCSTPYQIMLAVLLKLQCLEDKDEADLIITDTFDGYEKIASRIKNTKYFAHVYVANVKKISDAKNWKFKLKKIRYCFFFKNDIETIIRKDTKYDQFFFNNEDIYIFNMITYLKIRNRNCKICRYEEGYSSYTKLDTFSPRSQKIVQFRNRVTGNGASLSWDEFYVLEPALLIKSYSATIKQIDRSYAYTNEYRNFLECVFELKRIGKAYQQKYIIFEESFSNDGFDIDDIDIYRKIIAAVGKQNVIVRLHPRSSKNRFADMGVIVKSSEGIPWEAVVLTAYAAESVFIAMGSGSVINSRLLLGDNTKAFLLYKCLKKRPPIFDMNFETFIRKFQREYGESIAIPDTPKEAMKQLTSIDSNNSEIE